MYMYNCSSTSTKTYSNSNSEHNSALRLDCESCRTGYNTHVISILDAPRHLFSPGHHIPEESDQIIVVVEVSPLSENERGKS